MQKRKWASLATLSALGLSLVGSFGGIQEVNAEGAEWNVERYGDTLDVDTYLETLSEDEDFLNEAEQKVREQASDLNFDSAEDSETSSNEGNFTYDGGTKLFLDYNLQFKEYTLRSVGDNVEIWVANDIAFPEGDPRPSPVVTQAKVDTLRD